MLYAAVKVFKRIILEIEEADGQAFSEDKIASDPTRSAQWDTEASTEPPIYYHTRTNPVLLN